MKMKHINLLIMFTLVVGVTLGVPGQPHVERAGER